MTTDRIREDFKKRFNSNARLYASPGRVNLIGDHTDYNLGFVLPGAIDKAIYAAIAPNNSNICRVYSIDYDEYIEFSLNKDSLPDQFWARYLYGVTQEINKLGKSVPGFDCVFGGDVPLGAGLSSSAALESVIGYGLNDIFGFGLSRVELAKVGQMCEHNYIGVRCGIMDQFASLMGEHNKLIKLDCRSLDYDLEPFNPVGYKVVLIDTQVKHSLASSQYNVRREQCERGVAVIRKHVKGIDSLRDITIDMLNTYRSEMDSDTYQRCTYVISENKRLTDGCEALLKGDYITFGQKMFESHDGLSKMYEVSCDELDFLVDNARKFDAVIGSRMMGGGFGGCTINIIKEQEYDEIITRLCAEYRKKFNQNARVIDVVIGDGARFIQE